MKFTTQKNKIIKKIIPGGLTNVNPVDDVKGELMNGLWSKSYVEAWSS